MILKCSLWAFWRILKYSRDHEFFGHLDPNTLVPFRPLLWRSWKLRGSSVRCLPLSLSSGRICMGGQLSPFHLSKLWVWVAEVSWGQHKWDKEAEWGGGVRIGLWTFLVEIPPLQLPTQLRISGYHSLPDPRLLSFLAGLARKHACRNHNSWISRQIINWGNDWAASGSTA